MGYYIRILSRSEQIPSVAKIRRALAKRKLAGRLIVETAIDDDWTHVNGVVRFRRQHRLAWGRFDRAAKAARQGQEAANVLQQRRVNAGGFRRFEPEAWCLVG